MEPNAEQGDQPSGGPSAAQRIGALAVLLLIIAGILYGLLFSVNKLAMINAVPILGYVFWSTLGAGALQLVLCAVLGDLPRLSRAHLRLYLVGGAIGIALPMSLLAYVAPHLPASLVVIGTVLSPMLTYLMALMVKLERFRLLSLAGLVVGLGGVLLLVVPGASLPSFEMVTWLLIALLAPVCFAAFNIFATVYWPGVSNSLPLACGVQLGALAVLVPVMLGTGQVYLFPGPLIDGDLAVLWAVLINAAVWYLVFEIIRLAGPVFLSQFAYIIVLTGFGWGVLIFGESLNPFVWGAAGLLFAGLALLTLGRRRARASAD